MMLCETTSSTVALQDVVLLFILLSQDINSQMATKIIGLMRSGLIFMALLYRKQRISTSGSRDLRAYTVHVHQPYFIVFLLVHVRTPGY